MPHLQPDGMIHRVAEPVGEPGLGRAPAPHKPPIGLLDLIPVVGISEEKGDVGPQIETVIDEIGIRRGQTVVAFVVPIRIQTIALGPAPIRGGPVPEAMIRPSSTARCGI